MYIGETNNMGRRHGLEYRLHGDHLAGFLTAALEDGCTVWRRVRYTVRAAAAAQLTRPPLSHGVRKDVLWRRSTCLRDAFSNENIFCASLRSLVGAREKRNAVISLYLSFFLSLSFYARDLQWCNVRCLACHHPVNCVENYCLSGLCKASLEAVVDF